MIKNFLNSSENTLQSKEYWMHLQKVITLDNKLRKQLEDSNKCVRDTLRELNTAFLELLVICHEEGYVSGFKDGSKIMIEVFEK